MRIFLRQIAGGRIVPIVDERFADVDRQRWPQWSPDGTRIVFQAGRQPLSSRVTSGDGVLYEVLALGGSPRKLLASVPGRLALSPSWSPDGSQIVFGGSGGLYVAASNGDGVPRLLVADAELHSPRWSADASKIVYVRLGSVFAFGEEAVGNVSTSAIRVLTLRTGRVDDITSGEWLDTSPVWMPDSRTLLFVSTRGGARDIYSVRLTAHAKPEHEPQRLTSGLNAHGISVAGNGKLVVYSAYESRANIWSVGVPKNGEASVTDARQVTFSNEKIEKLAVSRDGQWLAYDSDRNGQTDIWKLRLPDGTPQQVTRGPYPKFVNDWSPDGREILFHSIRDNTLRDVFVVSADGTRTEPVATTSAEEQHADGAPMQTRSSSIDRRG